MTDFAVEQVETTTAAVLRRVVAIDALPAFFDQAFGVVAGEVGRAGGRIAGPPFGWYHGMPTDVVHVSAGFPVAGDVHTPDGGVQVLERPGGRAVVGVHVGPYAELARTYSELREWMAEHSLVPREDMWEEYLSPPGADAAHTRTRLVTPLA
jgi:effector-binding domain-containing protein